MIFGVETNQKPSPRGNKFTGIGDFIELKRLSSDNYVKWNTCYLKELYGK